MRNSIATLLLAGVLMLSAAAAAAQATDPIGVLKSDAPLKDKQDACRQLSIKGTKDAVPVLAPLLTDKELSHMARYALEPMPYPEAGKALRDALGKTSGRLKVGIISSLAIRKDEQAVPKLIKLLRNRDADVAQASARALGTIASPKAEKALEGAVAHSKLDPGMRDALCNGLFSVAEQRVQETQRDQAVKIYDRLLHLKNATPEILTAALRGAVLNRSADQGIPLLVDRLLGDDDAFAATLRVSREMDENHAATTAALAGHLPKASPARKVRILDVFGSGDGDIAGPAALALANDGDSEVRIAALRAVTRMNYSPALKVLAQLALSDDEKLAEVAKSSLAYFPGTDRNAAIEGMLKSDQATARRVAIALIGQGGLDKPVALLMNTAETDNDEGVRVAALEGLRDYAGIEEMPRLLDKMIKAQSQAEMHAAESTLTALCERQQAMPGGIAVIVDALCGAFRQVQGDAKLAALRLLGVAGSPKALEVVRAAAKTGATKDTALHTLCNWPTPDALSTVMELAKTSPDNTIRDAALRGAVRLLGQSGDAPAKTLGHYSALMGQARTPDDRRMVLSGLTLVPHAGALELALAQFSDESVKPEAVQTAIVIANNLGKAASEDKTFFNGKDLDGWQGNTKVWRVEDGVLVGQNKEAIAHDEVLTSDHKTSDFYLVADVTVEPNSGCGAIKFRLEKGAGYQLCVGQDAWGNLTAEPGVGKTDATGDAKKAVKLGQSNHCEILAVGSAVWVSINGKLAVAYLDTNKTSDRSGPIALQLYSGAPQAIHYRIQRLVLDPKVELEGLSAKDLIGALRVAGK